MYACKGYEDNSITALSMREHDVFLDLLTHDGTLITALYCSFCRLCFGYGEMLHIL